MSAPIVRVPAVSVDRFSGAQAFGVGVGTGVGVGASVGVGAAVGVGSGVEVGSDPDLCVRGSDSDLRVQQGP